MAFESTDPLLFACSRLDWAAAGRHWREGAPASPARALASLLAALASLDARAQAPQPPAHMPSFKGAARGKAEGFDEALGVDAASRNEAADSILKPLCARACQGLDGREDARAAHCFQALSAQLGAHGLHECLSTLRESLRQSPLAAALALSLEPLVDRLFPLDARAFLGPLSARERRLAPESLAAALQECDHHWLGAIERALGRCSRAQSRYWPDGRESLAELACAAIRARQEAIELYGPASVSREPARARRL